VSQANAELLRVKIADLEEAGNTFEAQQKKLKNQCIDREQTLGKIEAALEEKTGECSLLVSENATLQAKVQELMVTLASKDQIDHSSRQLQGCGGKTDRGVCLQFC